VQCLEVISIQSITQTANAVTVTFKLMMGWTEHVIAKSCRNQQNKTIKMTKIDLDINKINLTLPYLTLPSGWTVVGCPALRPYLFGPMHIPDVTIGYNNLLVLLANRIWDLGLTSLNSLRSSIYPPSMVFLSCTPAGHFPRK